MHFPSDAIESAFSLKISNDSHILHSALWLIARSNVKQGPVSWGYSAPCRSLSREEIKFPSRSFIGNLNGRPFVCIRFHSSILCTFKRVFQCKIVLNKWLISKMSLFYWFDMKERRVYSKDTFFTNFDRLYYYTEWGLYWFLCFPIAEDIFTVSWNFTPSPETFTWKRKTELK